MRAVAGVDYQAQLRREDRPPFEVLEDRFATPRPASLLIRRSEDVDAERSGGRDKPVSRP